MKTNDAGYSKKAFVFLDVLGFERLVNESRSDPLLISKVVNILARSKQIATSNLNAKLTILQVNSDEYTYRTFSDTSIISGPYESHDDMNFLSMWVMYYQYIMWKEEQTFVRGAIVYGEIYEDKDIVFGPALIEAYHLEKEKASWPRVVVDKSLLNKTTETERARDFYEFLRQDDDSLVYLDYLRELFHLITVAENRRISGQRKDDFGNLVELFMHHKQAILAQCRNALKEEDEKKREDLRKKYIELSKYHNSTISRLGQVAKDLANNNGLIRDFYDDLNQFEKARRGGIAYELKYSAEEHPEQSEWLGILGAAQNRLLNSWNENLLPGIPEEVFRTFARELPRELLALAKALEESMIEITKLGLEV